MNKLLASAAFVAMVVASGSAFATSYTVTGTNAAYCNITDTGNSTTWAAGELFVNGAATEQEINDTVASITCNAGATRFSMSSTNNGLTQGGKWTTAMDRVNYTATVSLTGVESESIDTADAVSAGPVLTTGDTFLPVMSVPNGSPLTVSLTTTAGGMISAGDYTDTLVFTILPQ